MRVPGWSIDAAEKIILLPSAVINAAAMEPIAG
jgi:hypothetical protein